MTALLLLLLAAGPRPLSLDEYRGALEQIDSLLDRGDGAAAARQAASLVDRPVIWNGGTLATDRQLLRAIAGGAGDRSRPTLRELLAVLRGAPVDPPPGVPLDRDRLAEIAKLQRHPPAMGGTLPEVPEIEIPWRERVSQWLGTVTRWIGARLRALARWLESWWKPGRPAEPSLLPMGGIGGPVLFVVGGIALLLVALVFVGLLRRTPTPEEAAAPPLATDADADPTRRDVPEWRAHADALAAAGRYREAIRAWYHAVLVTSFQAGLLQHRRGTTNREYARALPPDLPWAPEFAELTHRFDLEWYGRPASSRQTLEEFSRTATGLLSHMGVAAA